MVPPARLNATQLAQVRELIAEEFNNAFNEVIPHVTTNIIDQVRALLDERMAAVPPPVGIVPVPPVRDLMYYYEKFGKCHPPHWDGEDDPVAAKHWLSDVEGAFMTIGCPDQYRVLVAKNQLRKRGKTWWNTTTGRMTEENVRAITWAQFVEWFEARYVPKVEQQRMMQEFMALQQTTESVSDLNAKFMEMLSFCPTFAGDEAWLINRYMSILRTEIREFVSMQDFTTLDAVMGAARKREIELQTQSKRKLESTSSKSSSEAQKKAKFAEKTRYEYKPSAKQGDRPPLVCYNCKKEGHHWKNCKAPKAITAPQVTATDATVPVCYNCQEKGHKKPDCPKLKKSGNSNPNAAPSFNGRTMMTRGRVHQLTGDEPAKPATVAGK